MLYEELTRRFPDMIVTPGAAPRYAEHALVHAIDSLLVQYTTEGR